MVSPMKSPSWIRPAVRMQRLTAGFTLHPDTGPLPSVIVTRARPNADEISSTSMDAAPPPMPTMTAPPQLKGTSVNVPMNLSVSYFIVSALQCLRLLLTGEGYLLTVVHGERFLRPNAGAFVALSERYGRLSAPEISFRQSFTRKPEALGHGYL